ncbi:hypothetical protein Rsub_11383 [Raphidocelis subcapitata]|uniref:EF-hand domain-containing protein n=1 Tax=Raphidocelis subcapitata TaxID=307507 RepID=A0A2V0PG53_9CHLO|nr:hypothetical protein Rsub_11383 [Raphidocelis subcapitata]|eukprot:GBF98801.1 hypothetical protein Rsub_11383 [Raphidocelis subcapitata]
MGACISKAADTAMGAKLQAIINDPNTLERPLNFAFKHFDKDGSGYIEASEVMAVVEKVSRLAGLQKAPSPAINVVFDKVAGADGRLDKEEFKHLLQKMFSLAQQEAKDRMEGAKAPTAAA